MPAGSKASALRSSDRTATSGAPPIPIGTAGQISYYGKPVGSYRVSDHWNWYAPLYKCSRPEYIQCLSVDLPWARRRSEHGKASRPISACQVAVIGKDGKYHHIFGGRFDRATKIWRWDESLTPEEAAAIVQELKPEENTRDDFWVPFFGDLTVFFGQASDQQKDSNLG